MEMLLTLRMRTVTTSQFSEQIIIITYRLNEKVI